MLKARFFTVLFVLLLAVTGPTQARQLYNVAILVVDDFTGSSIVPEFEAGENCAVNLEEQAYAVRGSSDAPLDQPHGDVVTSQIEEMLTEAGLESIPLIQVDIHGATTSEAAAAIQQAISANPADFYVINMSFAVIPCEYVQAIADMGGELLDARNAGDLNRYRSLFQRAVVFYGDQVYPAMSQHAQDLENLDPLQELFTSLGNSVIPVASAGNFGLKFPFWPGGWSQVISVSGSTGQGYHPPASWDKKKDTPLLMQDSGQPNKKNRVSNYGEIMMPGEYTDPDGNGYLGTSFAAPRLTVALANYLMQVGSANCGPALAYGDWENLTLTEAAQQYCPDLVAYLPQP